MTDLPPVIQKEPCDDDGCKNVWQSWTLWASLIAAIAPFVPPVQAFLVANPEFISTIGVLFGALRMKTQGPVKLKKG